MFRPALAALVLLTVCAPLHANQLYKCVDAKGKVEYASSPCKGKSEKFHPRKGSVTHMKMPKLAPTPAPSTSGATMTAEQKRQMDELGIKPGGAVQMKPLVIPESWLK
jgi:Domain of unknown function (DUF4124)